MVGLGRRALVVASVLVAVLAGPAARAWADAGEPDLSFGKYGLTLVSATKFQATHFPRAIAIDGKGRIVVAGCWVHALTEQPIVVRFEPDGSLDPSFGQNGIVQPPWTVPYGVACIDGVAIDGAGRIVIGGTTARQAFRYDFAVGRLLEDGSPDQSFGNGGLTTVDSGSDGDFGTALAIDGQGRILLGGTIDSRAGATERAVAIRVTSDGSLDPSFGTDGIASAGFGGGSSAEAIAVEPSGAVLLAGAATVLGSRQFALARLDSHGNPDPSLGGDGRMTLDPPGPAAKVAAAVAVDGSGRLLLAGREGLEGNEAAPVIRLLADGSPDPSFGIDGTLLLPFPQPAEANAVAVDPRGRIVVAGGVRSGEYKWEPFLARLHSDGAMDKSFGREGIVLDNRVISPFSSGAQGLAIDSAGRYLISAEVREGLVVARYLPEAPVAPSHPSRCRGKKATIVGTPGRDVLRGTKGRDVIAGLGGNDVIRGLGGNDRICGDVGRDRLYGGNGRDHLFGGKGADLLVGGRGRDRLRGGPGRDVQR